MNTAFQEAITVRAFASPAWDAWAATVQGRRQVQQDRWAVLGHGDGLLVGVFDGVGGHSFGAQAAQAAADALPSLPSHGLDAIDAAVCATGGMATGVAVVAGRRLHIHGVGDAHCFAEGRDLLPMDRLEDGALSDCLGLPMRRGHRCTSDADVVLLATDGIEAADHEAVLRCLREADRRSVARLMQEVVDRGIPDNTTVVLLRRRVEEAQASSRPHGWPSDVG